MLDATANELLKSETVRVQCQERADKLSLNKDELSTESLCKLQKRPATAVIFRPGKTAGNHCSGA